MGAVPVSPPFVYESVKVREYTAYRVVVVGDMLPVALYVFAWALVSARQPARLQPLSATGVAALPLGTVIAVTDALVPLMRYWLPEVVVVKLELYPLLKETVRFHTAYSVTDPFTALDRLLCAAELFLSTVPAFARAAVVAQPAKTQPPPRSVGAVNPFALRLDATP